MDCKKIKIKINDSINAKFDVKSPTNSIPKGKNTFL